MRVPSPKGMPCLGLFVGTLLPAVAISFARGQEFPGHPPSSCPVPQVVPLPYPPAPPSPAPAPERQPPAPPEQVAPGPEQPPPAPTEAPPAPPPMAAAAVGGEAVALGAAAAPPNMLGDFLGSSEFRCVPFQRTILVPQTVTVFVPQTITVPTPPIGTRPPGTTQITVNVPLPITVTVPVALAQQQCYRVPAACHTFKIADDDSPLPQDRVYADYNYYNDVFFSANERLGANVGNISVNRGAVGFEKTAWDGLVSIGMRLPINNLNVGDSSVPEANGDFTDVGDLSIITKVVLWQDQASGSLLSGGLAVTVPTGPSSFAGVPFTVGCPHGTLLQPYLGFLWNQGDFFLHGFSALDIPTAEGDTTLMYQDVGIGYFLLRRRDGHGWLTAVAPTLEAHLTVPLNNKGTIGSPLWTPDLLDLTEGVTFGFGRRSTLALGVAEPVTGPRPFDIEAIAQMNIRF